MAQKIKYLVFLQNSSFGSQHPHVSSQPFITSLGDPRTSSGLHAYCAGGAHTHTNVGKTYTDRI